MKLLLRWVIAAASLWLTLLLLDNFLDPLTREHTKIAGQDTILMMLVATAVLAFANAFIRPIVKLLTLPLTCLTLGLFSLVVNALFFWGVGALTGAYEVGFWGALVGAILMAVINGAASNLIPDREEG